jgi:S1-C subfamily serine protease
VPVHGVNDLQRLMTGERIGVPVELTLVRNGVERPARLKPEELGG